MPTSRILRWLTWTIVLVLFLWAGMIFLDGPIRSYTLKRINGKMQNYRVDIADIDLNPLNLGFILDGLVISQTAHPDPPVLELDELYFSLSWRDILRGRFVGACDLVRPKLHINLTQLKEEDRDEKPLSEKGWQVFLEVYPLEINRLEILEGEMVYIDDDANHPIRLSSINATTGKIRYVSNPENTYPSPFRIEAVVFESGKLQADGHADFLAEPFPGAEGSFQLKDMPLGYLKPALDQLGIILTSGVFNTDGHIEYSADTRDVTFKNLAVTGLKLDYVLDDSSFPAPPADSDEAIELHYFVKKLHIDGEAGFINATESPQYRLFVNDIKLDISSLSDRFRKGGADVDMTGRFMGSGDILVTGTFAEADSRPDFTLFTKIVGTRLKSMNNLLRAHTNLDVTDGSFSLYSEIDVSNGRIDGYVKPFFAGVDIYGEEQDKRQNLLQQMYEGFMDIIEDLLENEPRKLATKVDISGSLENPDASTMQIIVNMIANAFFEAIVPGFDAYIEQNSPLPPAEEN